ncbi:MAG: hydrogenase maturation protease [Bacteroidota bacterium]
MPDNILILGLGNILMRDEGVGVKVVEYLKGKPLPEYVTILDGGTGGFHLLSIIQTYKRVIIIDATTGGEIQEEIKVLKPRFASDFPKTLTSHEIGLKDLIESAELLGELPEISLITINIRECNSVGIGVSPALEKKFPDIYETVQRILLT